MLATIRAAAPRMGSPTGAGRSAAGQVPAPAGGAAALGGAAGPRRAAGRGDGGRRGHGLRVGVAAVVGEEVPPALADRGRVGQVLLVHLVDQPGVGAEGARQQVVMGIGGFTHAVERTGASIHH